MLADNALFSGSIPLLFARHSSESWNPAFSLGEQSRAKAGFQLSLE